MMDYRKLLDEYYEYLGDVRPIHKMITNHLLFFADWLNTRTGGGMMKDYHIYEDGGVPMIIPTDTQYRGG